MSVDSMIFKLPKYLLKNNGFDDEIFEFLKIKKVIYDYYAELLEETA